MINRFFRQLLSVRHDYGSPLLQQRAQKLIWLIWAMIGTLALVAVLRAVASSLQRFETPTAQSVPAAFLLVILGLLLAYLLVQRGRANIAIWVSVGIMLAIFMYAVATTISTIAPVALILPLVVAGMLLSRRGLLLVTVLVLLTLIIHTVNQGQDLGVVRYVPADNAVPEFVAYGIFFGLASIFLFIFGGSGERLIGGALRDINQFKAADKFTSAVAGAADENAVLHRLIDVIQDDLGFALAQIYLPAADGEYSRRMRSGLGQSAHVALGGERTLITEAIRTRQPILLSTRDLRLRSDHLVPPADEGILLALASGDVLIGVLDVQGDRARQFNRNAVAVLAGLAMQAAHEVSLIRQLYELQRSVREQEAVIDRFSGQMSELQQRSQSVSTATWSQYLEGRGQTGFGFDYDGSMIVPSSSLPDEIREAVERGEITSDRRDDTQVVHVPIILRDQIIGAFTFNLPRDRAIGERQLEMLRTVANRLGVALESNRLLEQTQAQALRERRASEIGSVLLSATDVETVLDLAASNFNEALGAVQTRVYLDPARLVHSGEVQ